ILPGQVWHAVLTLSLWRSTMTPRTLRAMGRTSFRSNAWKHFSPNLSRSTNLLMRIHKPQRRRVAENRSFSIAALAAIVFVCQGAAIAQTDTRVSATWKVQQYDITATMPTSDADRNLTAKAQLNLKNVSSRPATTLTLRISTAAQVSAVALNGTSQ